MTAPRASVDVAATLASDPVVGRLPRDAIATLASAAKLESYRSRVLLQPAGEPLPWLRYVIRGHIELVARRASGGEASFGEFGPGDWATWVACLAPMPPEHDLYGSAGLRAIALPTPLVRRVCAQHPDVYPCVIGYMGMRMRYLMGWLAGSILLDPVRHMANLLHLLARVHRLPAGGGALEVTQARLASMARCSRQSANLLLNELEARGLVSLAYGRVTIPDLAALQAFVEVEPPRD